MSKSYYIYISSKNREISEKIYDFNVILNNPIIVNKNQGINLSVDYFSMLIIMKIVIIIIFLMVIILIYH